MLKNIVEKKGSSKPNLILWKQKKSQTKSLSKISVKSDHSSSWKDRNIEHHGSLISSSKKMLPEE